METLDNSDWDVLIVGTGLKQSLLALALSHSGKKILHVDENDYYGGAEAALSLQEAEEWIKKSNDASSAAAFANASVIRPEPTESDTSAPSLSFSRAYSLALSPRIIYARSTLLQYLVSSKVYRQLEFLAVGSWWVFSAQPGKESASSEEQSLHIGKLLKVPNGREDVFQDEVLDFKAKRALMKFLRFIAEFEERTEIREEHSEQPFPAFLSEQFKVPASLQAPLLALTLSPQSSNQTTTGYALPRIARHLRSIGFFGAGFGAVIPKWGGISEITQVACRASAVGGGVYVLGKGLSRDSEDRLGTSRAPGHGGSADIKLRLKDGEVITTKWLVEETPQGPVPAPSACKLVAIVSSPLAQLFPPISDEAPPPASAVVVFPSGTLALYTSTAQTDELPPVNILVHSNETGECPAGQSVLYASTSLGGEHGFELLKKATQALLATVEVQPSPSLLWFLQYEQRAGASTASVPSSPRGHELHFTASPLDLAFDDSVLDQVKEVWQRIVDDDGADFLVFEDREAQVDDDE